MSEPAEVAPRRQTKEIQAVTDSLGPAEGKLACLVVEPLGPARTRLIETLTAKGLNVVGAVNHVDAVSQVGRHGVPQSFIVSAPTGDKDALAFVRGLLKVDKTKDRTVILLLDDAQAIDRMLCRGLPENVLVMSRFQPVHTLVAALQKRIAPAGYHAVSPDTPVATASPPAESPGSVLTGTPGVTEKHIYAIDRAFDTFAEVLDTIRHNRLPGPMVPDVVLRVRELFSNPDVDVGTVARFVMQHQTLTARLIAVANSAYYARGARTTTIPAAVTRLGLKEASAQLHTIAMRSFLVCKEPRLHDWILKQLEVAYVVALVGSTLAARASLDRNYAYTVGLFHNVGATFLLYTTGLLWDQKVVRSINFGGLAAIVASRSADLNRLVADHLTLPIEITAIHANSPSTASPLVTAIHQAMWVADRLLQARDAAALKVDIEAQVLGLTEDAMAVIRAEAPAWLDLVAVYGGAA